MLPAVRTDQEWKAVVGDEQVIRPAAEDLAGRLGLAGEARVLEYLHGRLPVATPELLATASTRTAGTTCSCRSSPAPSWPRPGPPSRGHPGLPGPDLVRHHLNAATIHSTPTPPRRAPTLDLPGLRLTAWSPKQGN